jgi:transcriptional regulator with XRE-family HTH domain
MIFCVNGVDYEFDVDKDGYPNCGQVMRYFRRLKGYSASYVADKLGDVSERWIFKMESENSVPEAISRRRAICLLLDIPPALLGLATVDDVRYLDMSEMKALKTVDMDVYL